MLISLLSFKGGVGKTTTAVHLSEYLSKTGKTLLVDADPNASAKAWAARGGDRFPVPVKDLVSMLTEAKEYDHIVVDTAARPQATEIDSLLGASDFVIVPTAPSALAMDVVPGTVSQIIKSGVPYKVLITMADPSARRQVAREAAAALSQAEIPIATQTIRRYAVYEKASLAGCTVSGVRDPKSGIAASEYTKAFDEILGGLL